LFSEYFSLLGPLGYDEAHRELFPRDDLIKLAGDDVRDLRIPEDLP
jgi:hypothetical protein